MQRPPQIAFALALNLKPHTTEHATQSYKVVVGAPGLGSATGVGTAGGVSYFINTSTVAGVSWGELSA